MAVFPEPQNTPDSFDEGLQPPNLEEDSEEDDVGRGGEWDTHVEGKEYDVSPLQDETVMMTVIKKGEGKKVRRNADVTINYKGRKAGSEEVFAEQDGFEFKLSSDDVPRSISDCVGSMKKGESCKVLIKQKPTPHDDDSKSKITVPKDCELEFEITVVSWSVEEDISTKFDGTCMLRVLEDGEGWQKPSCLSKVELKYKLIDEESGKVIADHTSSAHCFTVDESDGVHPVIDHLAQKLKLKSIAELRVLKGEFSDKPLLVKDIEMVNFEILPPAWDLATPPLKLERAEEMKQKGNLCFKQEDYNRAWRRYDSAQQAIEILRDHTDAEIGKRAREALIPIHLNLAQCGLKLQKYQDVLKYCGDVLKEDGKNVKALYRSAAANRELEELQESLRLIKQALEISPKDIGVRQEHARITQAVKAQAEKDRKLFGGMFEKLRGFASSHRGPAAPPPQPDFQDDSSSSGGVPLEAEEGVPMDADAPDAGEAKDEE